MSVEEVISSIKNADAPVEDKIKAQEMILEAYEAEVQDRASARQRKWRLSKQDQTIYYLKLLGGV